VATPDLILLRVPWGLIGPSRTRLEMAEPIPESDTDGLDVDGCVSPLLFSRDDKPVPFARHRPVRLARFHQGV